MWSNLRSLHSLRMTEPLWYIQCWKEPKWRCSKRVSQVGHRMQLSCNRRVESLKVGGLCKTRRLVARAQPHTFAAVRPNCQQLQDRGCRQALWPASGRYQRLARRPGNSWGRQAGAGSTTWHPTGRRWWQGAGPSRGATGLGAHPLRQEWRAPHCLQAVATPKTVVMPPRVAAVQAAVAAWSALRNHLHGRKWLMSSTDGKLKGSAACNRTNQPTG